MPKHMLVCKRGRNMSAWNNLKIGTRLAAGIGLLLLLLIGITGAAYHSLTAAKSSFADYRQFARETKTAANWNGDLLTVRLHVKSFLIDGSDASRQKVAEAAKLLIDEVSQEKSVYIDAEDVAAVNEIVAQVGQYSDTFNQVADLQNQGAAA